MGAGAEAKPRKDVVVVTRLLPQEVALVRKRAAASDRSVLPTPELSPSWL